MDTACSTDKRYERCHARFCFRKHAKKKIMWGHLGADGWLIFNTV
jgi:hypothetical protein